MMPRQHRIIKAIALLLACSIFQLYAQAVPAGAVAGAQNTASQPAQTPGKLSTSGNKDILVDQNKANTGATILDGATLETSDCVSSTVRVGSSDEVVLATNTVAVASPRRMRARCSRKSTHGFSTTARNPAISNHVMILCSATRRNGTVVTAKPVCSGSARVASCLAAASGYGRSTNLSTAGEKLTTNRRIESDRHQRRFATLAPSAHAGR